MNSLPRWLGQDVPGFFSGAALIVVAIVAALFGLSLIVAGYDRHGQRHYPRWHPRRWVAPSFRWYFGWALIVGDVVTYSYLGFLIVRENGAIPRWYAISSVVFGACMVKAFQFFARERRDNGL